MPHPRGAVMPPVSEDQSSDLDGCAASSVFAVFMGSGEGKQVSLQEDPFIVSATGAREQDKEASPRDDSAATGASMEGASTEAETAHVPGSGEQLQDSPLQPEISTAVADDRAAMQEASFRDEWTPALQKRLTYQQMDSTSTDSTRQQEDGTGSQDITCVVPNISDRVHFLRDSAGFQEGEESSGASQHDWRQLEAAAFKDLRWDNALRHLREHGLCQSESQAIALLRDGARSFGLWHVAPASLKALAGHLLADGEADIEASPALQVWLDAQSELDASGSVNRSSGTLAPTRAIQPLKSARKMGSMATITECEVKEVATQRSQSQPLCGLLTTARKQKLVLCVLISAISLAFSFSQCNKDMTRLLGPFIVLARATGCASLLFTAALFLTMSRSLLNVLYRVVPPHFRFCRVLDSFTALHVFSGQMMVVTGLTHVFSHLLSTYSGLERDDVNDLNTILKCAQPDRYTFKDAFAVHFPSCPLERNMALSESLFATTAGLTGVGLLLVIGVMAYTGRQKRREASFEIFYYVHMVGCVAWIVLLFLHGMQGWFGIAVPLVLPICAVPVLLFTHDKLLRFLRFYLYKRGAVRIISAIIRPGKDGGENGALTALKIQKPPLLWSMRDGMYAFVCMPEYSSWQWHPFTIISGKESDTVDFIISGLGDWTQDLGRRVLDFKRGICAELPAIALDGPYTAPTATALACKVLIAVGSGIGITPFLALMSQLMAALKRDEEAGDEGRTSLLKEAHVFWIARSADEFLFGRQHFTKIVSQPYFRDKIHLHLHLTHKEPARDGPAFLFREAMRRQSKVDRRAFSQKRNEAVHSLLPSPQLPWCWVNGSSTDVLWVGFFSEALGHQEESDLAEVCQIHWDAKSRASSRRSLSCSSSALELGGGSLDAMLPICLGRPDWHREVQSIGKAWPEEDIHVYVCGSNAVVESLQDVCRVCNSHSQKARRLQRYILRRESFGKA